MRGPYYTVQKPFVYILQLAVHTVERNWISRLGRYLIGMGMVSDSSVSAETVVYEPFVLVREIRWSFSSLLSWRKGNV